jgi:hypothetical protein
MEKVLQAALVLRDAVLFVKTALSLRQERALTTDYTDNTDEKKR